MPVNAQRFNFEIKRLLSSESGDSAIDAVVVKSPAPRPSLTIPIQQRLEEKKGEKLKLTELLLAVCVYAV